jgi:TonB-dependent starch-binding outer membrane protein SusC
MRNLVGSLERSSVHTWYVALLAFALVLLSTPASAQTGTVEGQVTAAATGRPVTGAQVAIVGSNIGSRTGDDGRFVLLNVPSGPRQLRVTMIGFSMGTLQFTVQAGATTTANLSLSASVLRLDEVVVTGTAGSARRREVGNTIAQVDVASLPDPPQNVDQLLTARAPGVNISQGAGMAGSGAQIRLRGAVSVSQSNQPLIYIDGIRIKNDGYYKNVPPVGYNGRSGNIAASPINDINPNDIERVEIIKGAAASTLYGTDAAAGVIQIFTKRGSEGRTRWTFEADQGFAHELPFGTPENPWINMKPCTEGPTCWDQWTSNQVTASCATPDSGNQCSWLRDAYRQKYAASVGGGSNIVGYFVSGTYENNDGILPNDNEQKILTRANFNFNIADNVRVDVNTGYTNNRFANTAAGNNAHGLTLNVYRAERNYVSSLDPALLRRLLNQEITTDINRLIAGATVTYTPWTWFNNKFTFGYDFANQENRNNRPFGFVSAPGGILSDQQVNFTTLTGDYVGSLNFNLSEQIRSTFSFGGQSVATETVETTAYGDNFPGPGVQTVSNASTFISRESRIRVVTAGFFVQNVFDIADKLFVTGGVRFDGNSAFGTSLGIEAYPKVSASYVISDESFFPDALGEMKLRGAIGLAGRAPGAFDAVRTWSPVASNNDPAFIPDNIGNDSLGPERTREIEVGVDWGFLNNRISTEFTWYDQNTSDALFGVRQIPSNGFTQSQLINVGKIRNRGIELGVNATVFDQANWGLDLGANLYTNHSLVLDLGDAVPFAAGGGWVEEGFPVMGATGVRINNADEVAPYDTTCAFSCLPSTNGAVHMFGPQQPTKVFGGNVTLRLPKGISLSARGEYQGGAYIFDGPTNNALQRSIRWATCSNAFELLAAGPYTVDAAGNATGSAANLTAWERLSCIPARHVGDVHWEKMDFFKLRDLTARFPLEWLIPQTSSATLTLSLQNWIRWINGRGSASRADNVMPLFDPEMMDNGGTTRSGLDDQNRAITEHVPPPAVFTASLRFTF